MTPYDQFNQGGQQPYLRPATGNIDESQRAALAAALRQGTSQPSVGSQPSFDLGKFETMKNMGTAFDKLNGRNAASDYIGEFGKFDPQLQATLGNDATLMQKFAGIF